MTGVLTTREITILWMKEKHKVSKRGKKTKTIGTSGVAVNA